MHERKPWHGVTGTVVPWSLMLRLYGLYPCTKENSNWNCIVGLRYNTPILLIYITPRPLLVGWFDDLTRKNPSPIWPDNVFGGTLSLTQSNNHDHGVGAPGIPEEHITRAIEEPSLPQSDFETWTLLLLWICQLTSVGVRTVWLNWKRMYICRPTCVSRTDSFNMQTLSRPIARGVCVLEGNAKIRHPRAQPSPTHLLKEKWNCRRVD